MSEGIKTFISVFCIVFFFGILLLLIWWWYASQLEKLEEKKYNTITASYCIEYEPNNH